MVTLNISAKELQPHVKYPYKKKQIILGETTNFMLTNILKEVESTQTKQEQEELKKTLKAIRIAGISMLISLLPTQMAFAEPIMTEHEIITPSEITELALKLAMIAVAASIGLASILLVLASGYRMLRKKKEAKDWTTDIVKGLSQALVAIPTVYLIYYLSSLLFGNLEVFVQTFLQK